MKEFLASKDEDEAGRCWRELDVSFYGHQLVFTILVAAFEFPAKSDQLMQLIKRFEKSGEVSQVMPAIAVLHMMLVVSLLSAYHSLVEY